MFRGTEVNIEHSTKEETSMTVEDSTDMASNFRDNKLLGEDLIVIHKVRGVRKGVGCSRPTPVVFRRTAFTLQWFAAMANDGG